MKFIKLLKLFILQFLPIVVLLPSTGCEQGIMEDGQVITDASVISSSNSTATSSNNSSDLNKIPTLSSISDQTGDMGSSIRTITFSVNESNDPLYEEDSQTLTLSASSSNTTLIPTANIIINYNEGAGVDAASLSPTIDIHPAIGQTGTSTITITASDDGNSSKQQQTSFTVTISNPLSDVSSGLVLWFKADGGVYEDGIGNDFAEDGDAVQLWKDQSGNGNDADIIGGAPVLDLAKSGFNNKSTLDFDGIDDYVRTTNTVQPNTIFLVYRQTNVPNAYLVDLRDPFLGGSNWIYNNTFDAYGSIWDDLYVNGIIKPVNKNNISSDLFNGNFQIGVLHSNETSSRQLTLFTRYNIQQFGNGSLAEAIIFNRRVSVSERQKVEAYLGAKYEISTIPSTNQQLWLKADAGVKSDACGGTDATNNQTIACWEDQSGNSRNALPGSGPNLETNSLNGKPALSFDGTSEYLQVSDNDVFSPSENPVTLFTVFNKSSADSGTNTGIIGKGNWEWTLSLHSLTSQTLFVWNKTGQQIGSAVNTSAVNDDQWFITTTQIKNLQNTRIYHSGTLSGFNSFFNPGSYFCTMENTGNPLYIGRDAHGANWSFDGKMSEILLYNDELTETNRQRTELALAKKYNLPYSTHTVLDQPGIKLWLKADIGVNIERDYSAEFTASNNEFLSVADNASLSAGDIDFSISAWVYLSDKTATRSIISKYDTTSGNNREYDLYYDSAANRFVFSVTQNGLGATYSAVGATTFGAPPLKKWLFITAYHNASTDEIGISVNTGAANTAAAAAGGVYDGAADFNIGANRNGSQGFWQGRIARVGFWKNKILSNSEITTLYNNGSGLKYSELGSLDDANLIAYWDLDEGSGTRTNDNCTTSLDLTDNNTVTQGAGPELKVSSWIDQSPFGNSASQTTAADKPLWIADGGSGVANKPVIRFDGISDYFTFPDFASSFTAGEIFIVIKIDNDAPAGSKSGIWRFGGDPGQACHYPWNDGSIYDDFGSNARKTVGNPVTGLDQVNLYNVTSSSGNWEARLNGTSLYQTNTNTVTFTTSPTLGKSLSTFYFLDGDVAELIFYQNALSTTQRQQVECYLSDKYTLGLSGC